MFKQMYTEEEIKAIAGGSTPSEENHLYLHTIQCSYTGMGLIKDSNNITIIDYAYFYFYTNDATPFTSETLNTWLNDRFAGNTRIQSSYVRWYDATTILIPISLDTYYSSGNKYIYGNVYYYDTTDQKAKKINDVVLSGGAFKKDTVTQIY